MRVSVLPESEGSFVFFGDGLQEGRVGVFIPRSATGELLGWIFADAIVALADKESPNYIKPGEIADLKTIAEHSLRKYGEKPNFDMLLKRLRNETTQRETASGEQRLREIGISRREGGFVSLVWYRFTPGEQVFTSEAHKSSEPIEHTIANLRELADRMEINRETKL